jgi:hypothetical protein
MSCFKMGGRKLGVLALGLFISISTGVPVAAQNTPPAAQNTLAAQPGQDEQPLTPEQQREKEIRKYDPLYRSNPALDRDDSDRNSSGSGASAATPQPSAQPSRQETALPGSIAAGNQEVPDNPRNNQGPQVLDDADANAVQQYAGPAVLSRSYTLSRPMTPQQIKWSWNMGLNAIYSTGLSTGLVNPNGTVLYTSAPGESASWGFRGRHFWKRDQLGVAYSGSFNRFDGAERYGGQNENLSADFAHEFSRRLSLHLVQSGMILSQSYSLENPLGNAEVSAANLNLAASPTLQILGTGLRQTATTASLTWQKSARLSFSYGGTFFLTEATGLGLLGMTGMQAQSDMNYRITRKATVGAYYSFSNYVYTGHVEVADSNTFGGIFSYAFNRTVQLRLRGGVTRSENNGLSSIPIDPVIAALIGQSSVVIDSYSLSIFSDISAQLVKDFSRNRTANISYAHGLAPGNGLILSSVQQTISAAYSMRLFRHYTAGLALGQSSISSVSQTIGKYTSDYASLSLSRPYRHGLSGNFSVSYRRFTIEGGPPMPQTQIYLSSGFSWGPGEGRLW